jgi:hypothetical protein
MDALRRCRGVLLCNGSYTGCPYGDGDLTPLTGPCDCPVCHGSGFEGVIATMLPHQSFGDPDCCGCLNGVVRGDQADIVCNECEAVVRTVRLPISNELSMQWRAPLPVPVWGQGHDQHFSRWRQSDR